MHWQGNGTCAKQRAMLWYTPSNGFPTWILGQVTSQSVYPFSRCHYKPLRMLAFEPDNHIYICSADKAGCGGKRSLRRTCVHQKWPAESSSLELWLTGGVGPGSPATCLLLSTEELQVRVWRSNTRTAGILGMGCPAALGGQRAPF